MRVKKISRWPREPVNSLRSPYALMGNNGGCEQAQCTIRKVGWEGWFLVGLLTRGRLTKVLKQKSSRAHMNASFAKLSCVASVSFDEVIRSTVHPLSLTRRQPGSLSARHETMLTQDPRALMLLHSKFFLSLSFSFLFWREYFVKEKVIWKTLGCIIIESSDSCED